MVLPASLSCAQPNGRQLERKIRKAIFARELNISCGVILLSCRQPNHVLDDIENSVSSPINKDDISFEDDSFPIVR
jgi:hypothetical protein